MIHFWWPNDTHSDTFTVLTASEEKSLAEDFNPFSE